MVRLKITKEFWRIWGTEIKESKPTCSVCSNVLKIGDFVDHYYPHEQENNVCRECVLKGN